MRSIVSLLFAICFFVFAPPAFATEDFVQYFLDRDGKTTDVVQIRGSVVAAADGSMVRDGKWSEFYNATQVAWTGFYAKGLKTGPWAGWYPDGTKQYEAEFKSDQLNGTYSQYYENGKKWFDLKFKESSIKSPITVWYENGFKAGEGAVIGRNAKLDSYHLYLARQIGPVTDELMDAARQKGGPSVFLIDVAAETLFKHGVWEEFYPDGSKYFEGSYSLGNLTGAYQHWYQNGKKLDQRAAIPANSVRHKADPHWAQKEWYKNGRLKRAGCLDWGLKECGTWTEFYENGKPKAEGEYEAGKKEGRWVIYDESGKSHVENFVEGIAR